jgi:hypothetical protein
MTARRRLARSTSATSAAPAPPPAAPDLGPTTTPVATTTLDAGTSAALNTVLAGEHAVVWAYGALGPRLDEAGEEQARELLVVHERARDAVRAVVLGGGGTPVAAEPAYLLPADPVDPATAAAIARGIEERLAAVYGDLVAATADAAVRTIGVTGLLDCALRARSWGPTDTTFPGLTERATS